MLRRVRRSCGQDYQEQRVDVNAVTNPEDLVPLGLPNQFG